jgi:hypothetical protein
MLSPGFARVSARYKEVDKQHNDYYHGHDANNE